MTTPPTPPADAVARLTKLADDYASRGDFATEDDIHALIAAYADAARNAERLARDVRTVATAMIDDCVAVHGEQAAQSSRHKCVLLIESERLVEAVERFDAARTGEAR